jgi:NAD(P)-dependent dehydrogenase (short-subunit alcohol dehydrogenase family)
MMHESPAPRNEGGFKSTVASPKVVLVTGASSGIGKSCAELLCGAGYRVYGAARRGIEIRKDLADTLFSLRMDVTAEESVRKGLQTVMEREHRLDILINSAGAGIAAAVEDTSIADAREQLDVNLLGVLRTIRAVLPAMRKQQSGLIVNIGSICGLIAVPYQGLYSASKFALEGLTEALRLEVGRFNIRVVLIEPGDHRTCFTQNRRFTEEASRNPAYRDRFQRSITRMAFDEQNGPAPDQVARLVHRVIEKPNPRLRYTTGPSAQRAAVWLKRVAPHRLLEKLLEAYYS